MSFVKPLRILKLGIAEGAWLERTIILLHVLFSIAELTRGLDINHRRGSGLALLSTGEIVERVETSLEDVKSGFQNVLFIGHDSSPA
jgi:hypothetical protein